MNYLKSFLKKTANIILKMEFGHKHEKMTKMTKKIANVSVCSYREHSMYGSLLVCV